MQEFTQQPTSTAASQTITPVEVAHTAAGANKFGYVTITLDHRHPLQRPGQQHDNRNGATRGARVTSTSASIEPAPATPASPSAPTPGTTPCRSPAPRSSSTAGASFSRQGAVQVAIRTLYTVTISTDRRSRTTCGAASTWSTGARRRVPSGHRLHRPVLSTARRPTERWRALVSGSGTRRHALTPVTQSLSRPAVFRLPPRDAVPRRSFISSIATGDSWSLGPFVFLGQGLRQAIERSDHLRDAIAQFVMEVRVWTAGRARAPSIRRATP